MNKKLLLKNISNRTTPEEKMAVMEWLEKSPLNKEYYSKLNNLVASEDISPYDNRELSERDRRAAFKAIKRASRGEADKRNTAIFLRYAAATLLLLSVLLNFHYIFSGGSKDEGREAVIGEIPQTLFKPGEVTYTCYTENGVKGRVILPDSSVIWLNSGSRIEYPVSFGKDGRRKIAFSGEGYFEVVKNPDLPMEVKTQKGMMVTVLGTKFHLRSYSDENYESAMLLSGAINISKQVKKNGLQKVYETVALKPSESVVFNDILKEEEIVPADTVKNLAWKRGELLFTETPLDEVFRSLERWHGTDIVVRDSSILHHTFTGSFTSESLVQIMEFIKFTTYADYEIIANKVYVTRKNRN